MNHKHHTADQIIEKLRQAEQEQGKGLTIDQVCRKLEVSRQTYYRWVNKYGGMKLEEVRRMRQLERENQRLKRIVADRALDISILKEVAKGKF